MSPEEQLYEQFSNIVAKEKRTLAENKKLIKNGVICDRCFKSFDKPTGCPTVHAKCAGGRSDERLERLGYKRYE